MQKRTKFYPIEPHGGGGCDLPADREVYRRAPKPSEVRS